MKYVSKRTEVEAFQYIPGRLSEAPEWFHRDFDYAEGDRHLEVIFNDLIYHIFPSQWMIISNWELIILSDDSFRFLFESAPRNPFESPEGGEVFRCERAARERHVTRLETSPKGDLRVFYRDVREDGDFGEISCSIHAWRRWTKRPDVFIIRQN